MSKFNDHYRYPLPEKPNSSVEAYLDYIVRNGQYFDLTEANDGATHWEVVNGKWVPAGEDYLCYSSSDYSGEVILEYFGDGTPSFVPDLWYSTDKVNWTKVLPDTHGYSFNEGDKVYFKGKNNTFAEVYTDPDDGYTSPIIGWRFYLSQEVAIPAYVSGNMASVIFGADVNGLDLPDFAFAYFFDPSVYSVEKLPKCNLSRSCYLRTFSNCSSLIEAPELPATELAEECYESMFAGCESLATAPELPAMKLADYCYDYMFESCTSLTTAPELPATELAERCYEHMFDGCESLATAPELPAMKLAEGCYEGMFAGCMSITTAPELPAMELAGHCYNNMFSVCTSLTTAPELPATELADYCYTHMFDDCESLNEVSVEFTDFGNGTEGWLDGVAETGTFYCPEELTISERGADTVPSGWTIERITE